MFGDGITVLHGAFSAYQKALKLKSKCGDGWQAVDATPQEVSSGGAAVLEARNQMGPASVKLVKANANPACAWSSLAIYGCFDNEFVISEGIVITDSTSILHTIAFQPIVPCVVRMLICTRITTNATLKYLCYISAALSKESFRLC